MIAGLMDFSVGNGTQKYLLNDVISNISLLKLVENWSVDISRSESWNRKVDVKQDVMIEMTWFRWLKVGEIFCGPMTGFKTLYIL